MDFRAKCYKTSSQDWPLFFQNPKFQKDWMDSLELRATTVENKIAEFMRKLKNRLSEPKFWFGPCRSKKSLSDRHDRFSGFPMYRGFNIGGGSKWFWDFDDYARGLLLFSRLVLSKPLYKLTITNRQAGRQAGGQKKPLIGARANALPKNWKNEFRLVGLGLTP